MMQHSQKQARTKRVDLLVSDVANVWAMKRTMGVHQPVCIEVFNETEEEHEARDKQDPDGFHSRRETEQVLLKMERADIIQLQMMIGQTIYNSVYYEFEIKPEYLKAPLRDFIEDIVGKVRFIYNREHPSNKARDIERTKNLKEYYDKQKEAIEAKRTVLRQQLAELDALEQALNKN